MIFLWYIFSVWSFSIIPFDDDDDDIERRYMLIIFFMWGCSISLYSLKIVDFDDEHATNHKQMIKVEQSLTNVE